MPLLAEITRGPGRILRVNAVTIGGVTRLALQSYETRNGARGDVWAPLPGGLTLRPEELGPLINALCTAQNQLQPQPADQLPAPVPSPKL